MSDYQSCDYLSAVEVATHTGLSVRELRDAIAPPDGVNSC